MPNDLVHLNVGGQRFSTSKNTLLSLQGEETFFTSLLSGRIASNMDDSGAYFIDRDPSLFRLILNFLRTQQLHLLIEDSDARQISALIHEANYYGIAPLVKQLIMCQSVGKSSCGNILFCGQLQPPKAGTPVKLIKAHYSTIVVAFDCFFACYQHKGVAGYQRSFVSSSIDGVIEDIAIHVKMALNVDHQDVSKIVAVAHEKMVSVIGFASGACGGKEVHFGRFSLPMNVSHVFFVGYELIALSKNYIGVWRSQTWQSQRVASITSYDVGGGSFLFLGASNGSIYYIDMEKFPLRMSDNDLLVSELFRDPSVPSVAITSLSVYLPTKTKSFHGNSIEIAYGTSTGLVRVIVQYPETVGQGPHLYQTFSMHTSPIVDILLSDKCLVSTCANQHVRTWTVTRFRGMISTYPGSTVLASFALTDLEKLHADAESAAIEDCWNEMNNKPRLRTNGGGPDDEPLFIQKLSPNEIMLIQASNGDRVAEIHSVDSSPFVAFCEHDCDNSTTRSSSGTSNLLFTGHENGVIQMWDLQTAGVMFKKGSIKQPNSGSLKSHEMAKLLDSSRRLQL